MQLQDAIYRTRQDGASASSDLPDGFDPDTFPILARHWLGLDVADLTDRRGDTAPRLVGERAA